MTNQTIEASFSNRILSVRFLDNAVITDTDLQEVYDFADQNAEAQPYCVIFEAMGHYEVTEDAIDYISKNPHNKDVRAKAYVVNSREAEQKTKLHLLFDHPSLKPYTFKTVEEGKHWLTAVLDGLA